jgi:hypothetical protein
VKNEKNKKAKNVLGIHGRMSKLENSSSWPKRKQVLEERGINIDTPQFKNSEDPTYESWKETFDTIDFSKYDTVLAVSL